jgi:hypothetical protein
MDLVKITLPFLVIAQLVPKHRKTPFGKGGLMGLYLFILQYV